MKQILVISGKGGTGKTDVAASFAAIGAVLGYYIGSAIAKNAGMSPGETYSFVLSCII